jgi:hypothetical protein
MKGDDSEVSTEVDDAEKVILQSSTNSKDVDGDSVSGDKKGLPTLPTGSPIDEMEEENLQKNKPSSSSSSSSQNVNLLLSSENDNLRHSGRSNFGKTSKNLFSYRPNIVLKSHELSVPVEKVSSDGNINNKNAHEKLSSSSSAQRPELVGAVLDAQEKALQEANQNLEEQNFLKEQDADAHENKKSRGRPVRFPKPVGQYKEFKDALAAAPNEYVYTDDIGVGELQQKTNMGLLYWRQLSQFQHVFSNHPSMKDERRSIQWLMGKQAPWCAVQAPLCTGRSYSRCLKCSDDGLLDGDYPVCPPCQVFHFRILSFAYCMPTSRASNVVSTYTSRGERPNILTTDDI